MPWRGLLPATVVILFCGLSAGATQFSYEGDAFPEQEGWTQSGNAEEPLLYSRSISDGVFAIDAAAGGGATVYYSRDVDVLSDRMVYEWRARTTNDDGASILAMYVKTVPSWAEIVVSWADSPGFAYMYKGFGSLDVPTEFSIGSGEYHVFRVDVEGATYALSVDGVVQLQSELLPAAGLTGKVKFGFNKYLQNVRTTGEFDYIRLHYIPEPRSALLFCVSNCLVLATGLRKRSSSSLSSP